jgi:hypothetical protein
MLLEIGFAQEPAIGTHKRVDFVSDLAFVESVAPFLANQSQRSRQIWVLEDVAFTGRAFFAIKRVGCDKRSGLSLVEAWTKRPVIRDQIGDWKTFLGIANRRGEIVAQFQFAEFFVQLRPRVDASWNTDWEHAAWRNSLVMQLRQF